MGDIMGHEIDLKNYQIRTDLAIEAVESSSDSFDVVEEKFDSGTVTNVYIDDASGLKIGKKKGNYITISFEDVTDYHNLENIKDIFSNKLKDLLIKSNIKENDSCLVIGLGNPKSTPDSLGPNTINNILVTNHLYVLNSLEEGFRRVSSFNPGVMGTTGIETSDLIISVVESLKPDFIIVIDALASSSVERVNKTIQMTDTGIHPGSGIGNSRKEISKDVIGIPVIAVGVPTVVDAVTIVSDTINYMHKNFSYTKQNINNPMNKLIGKGGINYLKKDIKVKEEDKKELMGMIGGLEDSEIRQLIYEVLTPIGYNLMVTPKEVDFVVEKLCDLIGNGINKALHKKVDNL